MMFLSVAVIVLVLVVIYLEAEFKRERDACAKLEAKYKRAHEVVLELAADNQIGHIYGYIVLGDETLAEQAALQRKQDFFSSLKHARKGNKKNA